MKTYTNLVIEGSASKIYTFCGALDVLEKNKTLSTIKNYAGTSSGSILCFLLALGYTSEEITRIIFGVDVKKLLKEPFYKSIYNIFKKFGLYSTPNFKTFLEDRIFDKLGVRTLTFKELYDVTGKILVITGTCINKKETHYYHYQSNPDMDISQAVFISTRIPLVLSYYDWKGDILVDGALLDNYPIWFFNEQDILPNSREGKVKEDTTVELNTETLGIKVMEDSEAVTNKPIKNIFKFVMEILNTFVTHIDRIKIKKDYWERTILLKVPDIPVYNLDLPLDLRQNLYMIGETTTVEFFNKTPIINIPTKSPEVYVDLPYTFKKVDDVVS
jgi:patatin-like phospholipase/acyl hydrolase